jgi:hypothetical protein
MFRALTAWIDRDWASRKYNPLFAFGQRLLCFVPVFVSLGVIAIMKALGAEPNGTATLVVLALGAVAMLAVMLVSIYRWMVRYSRSDFQEHAAAEHRARVAARQALIRRWFRKVC